MPALPACPLVALQTLLTISRSRVVLATLVEAAKRNRRFSVFCTESRPSMSGLQMGETGSEAKGVFLHGSKRCFDAEAVRYVVADISVIFWQLTGVSLH